jgi:asparagine synthase (glutamine-hydrolysing)
LHGQPPAYLRAFFGAGLDRPDDPFFSHRPRWGLTARTRAFFSGDLRQALAGHDPVEDLRATLPAGYGGWHPLCRGQFLETAYLLPGYILSSQGDRVSMAHAVETRFPFLDHRVVELAARIPPRLKLRVLREKHILRRSMRALLPESILERPKQPYRAPEAECFFDGSPELVDELLSPEAIARAGYFDAAAVAKLVRKCRTRSTAGMREDMALVGILSVQVLDRELVRAR